MSVKITQAINRIITTRGTLKTENAAIEAVLFHHPSEQLKLTGKVKLRKNQEFMEELNAIEELLLDHKD